MGTFKDLIVYKKAFDFAMQIFALSTAFPTDEKYALTSQIRRSSRSVCSNLAEGYRKRQYPAHFLAKISDADMENIETIVWLDFALGCKYIDSLTYEKLVGSNREIGRLWGDMLKYPEKYFVKTELI